MLCSWGKGQETALMLTVQVVGGLYLLGKFCKTLM